MMIQELLDVQYNDLSGFDFYYGDSTATVICFVHGGAWRSEDKQDHSALARRLAIATNCSVAVPNYRLTSPSLPIHHPSHAKDILDFLNFLLIWSGPPDLAPSSNLFLIGHSCSAHMLASIFLDSHAVSPTLDPQPSLLRAVKAIIMSEGIYDIHLLINHFPSYFTAFIEPAFGPTKSYASYNVTQYPLRNSADAISWAVIHSKGDTLVDLAQSDAMYNHLRNLYGERAGVHVYRNVDQLEGEHNEILRGDQYVDIVQGFVSLVRGSTTSI